MEITVLEHSKVSPPPGSVAGKSLPLTFFDFSWINLQVKAVFFYDLPNSESNTTYFTQTLIPALKHSLSLTLKHFYPLAGKLIIPASSDKPEIRCSDDDFVSLTFAECCSSNHDIYNHLSGNHARNEDELFLLVPQLSSAGCSNYYPDCLLAQLLALQVTLFPGHGVSVGISNDHGFGDASTVFSFLRVWSLIAKLGGDGDGHVPSSFLPFYERSVIKSPKGVKDTYTNVVQKDEQKEENQSPPPAAPMSKKVRSTFIMSQANIQGLKNLVLTRRPTLVHVSTYTVACGYVWACMAKARKATGEKMLESEMEHFVIGIDCRPHLDPPIPETYFGNCLVPSFASIKTMELLGENQEGFVIAPESIGEGIKARLYNNKEEGGLFKNEEKWSREFEGIVMGHHRSFGVAGSPKFEFYNINFGWGRPKKLETVTAQFSMNKCMDLEGGLEIGLCLPEDEMIAFTTIFAEGMN